MTDCSADSLQSLSRPFRDHRVRHSRMQVVFFLLIGYKFITWLIPMNIGTCLSLEIGSRMPRDWFENGTIVAYFLHKQKSLPASRLCQHIAHSPFLFKGTNDSHRNNHACSMYPSRLRI